MATPDYKPDWKRAYGLVVRELREQLGLSRAALEKQANLSKGYVTKLEDQGIPEKPGGDKYRLIAKALQISPEDLYLRFEQKRDELKGEEASPLTAYIDWGEAPDIPTFYGRTDELVTLEQWVLHDRCRLVAILGIGGIGKTTLAVKLGMGGIGKSTLSIKLAKQIQSEFEYVIWRSLLNAPSLEDVLIDLIKSLSNQQEVKLSNGLSGKILQLIHYLRQHRCLIILDNVESILQGRERAGQYRDGYESYGNLFKQIGETPHNSCLLLTSREKPQEIALLEGKARPIRSFHLGGLDESEGRKIFKENGDFRGDDKDWRELIDFYNGNPLALDIVSKHIIWAFDGDISTFLKRGRQVFGDLRDLLDWHFNRLSDAEREIMYWLAINRVPISIVELQDDILLQDAKERAPETMQLLQRRLPIERTPEGFTLQPVLIEYTTEQLIEYIIKEVKVQNSFLLNSHALIKATVKEGIRQVQVDLILKQTLNKLIESLGSEKAVQLQLKEILYKHRRNYSKSPGYLGGNIINALVQMQFDLTGYDFSNLSIRQAFLRNVDFHQVNFTNADLTESVFHESSGSILGLEFSPDGKYLVSSDSCGEIRLWQVPKGKLLKVIKKAHRDWTNSCKFSPDGKKLISCSDDQTMKLWDVHTGECLKVFQEHTSPVFSIAFNPQGTLMVTGDYTGMIRVWEVSTWRCLSSLKNHTNRVFCLVFSSCGTILASSGDDCTIKLWNIQNINNIQCYRTFNEHTHWVRSVAFDQDNQILASGSYDQTIKLWDVNTGICFKTLQGHEDWISSIVFSNDSTIISGSADCTLKVWRISDGKCLRTLSGHTNWIRAVALSPDGKMLASGSEDTAIKLWEIQKEHCFQTLIGYANEVRSVVFHPKDNFIASAGDDCDVSFWNIKTGKRFKHLTKHTNRIETLAFSSDGKLLASGAGDGKIILWNARSSECLNDWKVGGLAVYSVAFSPDNKLLASCGEDTAITLWDVNTGERWKSLKSYHDQIRSVAFSPDGQLLVIASEDATVRLWNIFTDDVQIIGEHDGSAYTAVFSPNGQFIASGGTDKVIKLWNVRTNKCLQVLRGHEGRIWSVAFSPDGKTLASGSNDQTAKLWNIETGECIYSLSGNTMWVWGVAFSPDGKVLAAGCGGVIKLWDVETGSYLNQLIVPKPYEGMNITGTIGITKAQRESLKTLGAIEYT